MRYGRIGVSAGASGFYIAGLAVTLLLGEVQPADAFFWHDYRSRPYFDFRAPPHYARPKAKTKRAPAVPSASKVKPPRVKGPLQIVVSIAEQRIVVYDDGAEIARAKVSTGTPSHPTPTGVFSIIQKKKFHHSNLYSNAPMPYMQRITWSGIALHQGPLPGYPASHGCIRLPMDFAQKLWAMTKLGARVIVAHDMVSPIEMAHPALLKPRPLALRPSLGTAVNSPQYVQTAYNATEAASADGAPAPVGEASDRSKMNDVTGTTPPAAAAEAVKPTIPPARRGPITVFISRKEGRLFVRQDFEDVFDMPVSIRDAHRPIGTHVATAMAFDASGSDLRWSVVTVPEREARSEQARSTKAGGARGKAKGQKPASSPPPPPALAASAFDRIEIPQEALERIADLLTPGATMIVSDHGRSRETGKGTDFVVLTR